ncbi:helix-turn-helix transcriptional regulator [Nocardia cyriacigeorgica]|uniref:Helix-turn-helix transcriptional regulator n=1 Tax=Nocardia cyriacigeorgica TaxID=135487 RepID=A0A6P1D5A8_9NOCA|nr:metalloregulator ArsR/SmtB family transcription factor [Nocardia cyriacigeorgica]NEW39946.1 helix-turn-helix transcriptional regulator [Nocardia cyriacigeorgica]NEW45238.1 helix-turn-helix transcriptional regulator [Nocardia cyriacigeorgica]NEW51429.1 helix-turn-helix transcriptional regulator [Nocardia cyriacigeorgica]NEW55335.1 helix-turn-helix transcriptional regulator [Nocardia cyriacigeorgica]
MPGLSRPLYQMKADFFKTLGHPVRIRVLELLSEREHAVSEMLPEVGVEPANLSQQLSILRRAGLVTARREGLSVTYALTSPRVAELLATARAILTGVVAGQAELLEDTVVPATMAGEAGR